MNAGPGTGMASSTRHAHVLENELLKQNCRSLFGAFGGVADHRCDGVDDGFADGTGDFGRKPEYTSRSSVPKEIESSWLWWIQ